MNVSTKQMVASNFRSLEAIAKFVEKSLTAV